MRMRKINYKLKIAIIGEWPKGRDIILDYLKKNAIEKQEDTLDNFIFQLIHKYIPIKIHLTLYENMKVMLSELEPLNGFDFLFLILSIYDDNALNNYEKGLYDEICKEINFSGSSLLIALDVESMTNNFSTDKIRISRHRLIRKCNELDLEYCFEIINYKEDLNDLFKKILDDSLIKFKISNPELYEKAKELGVILSEKLEKI